jgi:hypothetical protein
MTRLQRWEAGHVERKVALLAGLREVVHGEVAAEQRQRLPQGATGAVIERAVETGVRDLELRVDGIRRQRELTAGVGLG